MAVRRVVLIANAAAGTAAAQGDELRRRIEAAFAARGVAVDARWVPGDRLTAAARAATHEAVDAVVAAGGDGTINAVARAVAGGPVPLGVIAAGTLNHFAKDVGLPLDPEGAVGVIADGFVRRVDLGEVNGRLFLNNSSIGAYPAAVEERERLRARGRRKWPAMAAAVLRTRRRMRPRHLRLEFAGVRLTHWTPAVMIANNAYALNGMGLGRRDRLDAGRLWCYVATDRGRPRLARLAMRTLFNRLDESPELISLPVRALLVSTPSHRLAVSLDGEIVRLSTPLRYRIRPGLLAVLAPAPAAAPAPDAPP